MPARRFSSAEGPGDVSAHGCAGRTGDGAGSFFGRRSNFHHSARVTGRRDTTMKNQNSMRKLRRTFQRWSAAGALLILAIPLAAQTPLTVTTTSLPDAIVGSTYPSQTLTATGGTAP